MYRGTTGSVMGTYKHREGIQVHPREILQSRAQGDSWA